METNSIFDPIRRFLEHCVSLSLSSPNVREILFTRNLSRSIYPLSRIVRMPRINYKPSNWKSGETARNVITLTGARFLREAESTLRLEISSLPPDQLSTTPLLIFHRCYSPPRFSISVEINQMHEGVELPKTPLPCRRDSD